METHISIDKAGRVVIPKELRDDFGLKAGDKLEIMRQDGHIVLSPEKPKGQLINKHGILVWSTGGPRITLEEVNEALRASRERHD